MNDTPLIRVEHLSLSHRQGHRAVPAVRDVSFDIRRGTTFGLVGESGSGKSTIARAIAGLKSIDDGRIRLDGEAIVTPGQRRRRDPTVARRIQMVFQDSASSFNPRHTIETVIAEPLQVHREGDAGARRARVLELLDSVGLPASVAGRYPHQLSGGQRQRVGIARALALRPDLVLLDEAVSALDLSVQAQILNLLVNLQASLGLTYLFISHDLSVIRHMADDVAVLRDGQLVEQGDVGILWDAAQADYTRRMIAAMPLADDFSTITLSQDI